MRFGQDRGTFIEMIRAKCGCWRSTSERAGGRFADDIVVVQAKAVQIIEVKAD